MSRYASKLYLDSSIVKSGGSLTFNKTNNTFGVSVAAPSALSANYTFQYPVTAGVAGQVLTTDGTGASSYVYGFTQGGNSFGAAATIGTFDNNQFDIYTNSVARLKISNAGDVALQGDATVARSLIFDDALNVNSISVKAPNTGITSYTLTLPAIAGTAGQTLKTNGSGATSWINTFTQSGNAFGATEIIGPTDNFAFTVQTDAVNRLTVTAGGDTTILGDSTVAHNLIFDDAANVNSISLKAPNTGITTYTLILPTAQAISSGQALVNDGSGNLHWGTPEPSDVIQFADTSVTSSATLTLLENLIEANATSANIVLTLPAIATAHGMLYMVYKTDASANTVQIVPATGESYNGVVNNSTVILSNQNDRTYAIGITGGWWTF
jgi:hypothetical protein